MTGMFLTIQQTRLFLAAIGVVAALVLALDLARVADHCAKRPSYGGLRRNSAEHAGLDGSPQSGRVPNCKPEPVAVRFLLRNL